MLILLFYIGDTSYAVKCAKIREIVPMVHLETAPHMPDFMSGFFNYRGEIVPVIDLCRLIRGNPCEMRLSTRIILVEYTNEKEDTCLIGFIAERVTRILNKEEHDFRQTSFESSDSIFMGEVMMEQGEMIHYIELDRLPDRLGFHPQLEYADSDD